MVCPGVACAGSCLTTLPSVIDKRGPRSFKAIMQPILANLLGKPAENRTIFEFSRAGFKSTSDPHLPRKVPTKPENAHGTITRAQSRKHPLAPTNLELAQSKCTSKISLRGMCFNWQHTCRPQM